MKNHKSMKLEGFDFRKEKRTDKIVSPRLTADSRFTFHCRKGMRCSSACCGNINIVLPPYDLLRLRKRLGMTAEDFISNYCVVEILARTFLPVIMIKMRDDEKRSCPFATPQGCAVYEDRPSTCRCYPVGMTPLGKQDAQGGKDEFYFMIREDHCKGFEENRDWTIADWRKDQEADLYDRMNRGWMDILAKKKSFPEKEFPKIKNQMFFLVSTDTDSFREFVFQSDFLETYDVPRERIEKVRIDDAELLQLGYDWLRSALFAEDTLKIRDDVDEACEDSSALTGL